MSVAGSAWRKVGTSPYAGLKLQWPGLTAEHFSVFVGSKTSYVIGHQELITHTGTLYGDDIAALDNGVQVLMLPGASEGLALVEGDEDTFDAASEERFRDKFFNSCPMCLCEGRCLRCGGSGKTVTRHYVENGYKYVESDCYTCGQSGRCPYCVKQRGVAQAVYDLVETKQFTRADALLESAFLELNPQVAKNDGKLDWTVLLAAGGTLLFPVIGTAVGALAGLAIDGNKANKAHRRKLASADFCFLRGIIFETRGDVKGAIPMYRQTLVLHPEHVGAIHVLQELGV